MNLRNYLIAGLLVLAFCAQVPAAVTISSSFRVCVSTNAASPTEVIAADQRADSTMLINSTTDYFYIGDADTTFSTSDTTGTARIPANSSITLDGPKQPYKGSVYGVSGGSGDLCLDVIRTK